MPRFKTVVVFDRGKMPLLRHMNELVGQFCKPAVILVTGGARDYHVKALIIDGTGVLA